MGAAGRPLLSFSRGEAGAGSVLALSVLAAVILVSCVLLAGVGALLTQARVQLALDSMALASANALSGVVIGKPCDFDSSEIDMPGVVSVTCELSEFDAFVSATVTFGPFRFDVRSRAGPKHS